MSSGWVGFDRELTTELVINVLKERFNLSGCYEYNINNLCDLLDELNLSNARENPSIVFYEVIRTESEFPIRWDFLWFPDLEGLVRVEIAIAYYLSQAFNCKTITDGTGFGIDNSPYWDIVFENGKILLVDDLETKFYGDGDNLLKYVNKGESLRSVLNEIDITKK